MTSAPSCVNITSAGERRRRLSGWAALLAGLIVIAGLAYRDAPSAAYLAVFPFALGAAFGFLQARNRTCVVLGLQGTAEVEGGGVRRLDEPERRQARAQAKRVLWKSILVATVVTLLIVLASGITVVVEP